jgi:hypothetical protein
VDSVHVMLGPICPIHNPPDHAPTPSAGKDKGQGAPWVGRSTCAHLETGFLPTALLAPTAERFRLFNRQHPRRSHRSRPSLTTGPKVSASHRERSSAAEGRTNLWNKGLTSADRSNKATLPLTVPRSHSSRLQRIYPRAFNNCHSQSSQRSLSATRAKTA